MSYRNIVVDGKSYKYVVGSSHVKICGIGAFLKTEVGTQVTIVRRCECCGEPLSELRGDHSGMWDRVDIQVKPSDVAKFIRGVSS